ncbi:hypothetical protein [Desulfovibrio ferrophilus]|uniref:TRAP dicarboxylate transporter-DctP subunit n=1 Tax=Desulfovibrio ferrophilus TaxID=241368 RepID=A0A2Z6B0M2_9BACT|nr:hypothetical protein [Desulfovibrio ferrophilus]BBD09059.1 TRAP dicarboxylate transporter-DctP subunit [Desulfovibrio ferrophilus]
MNRRVFLRRAAWMGGALLAGTPLAAAARVADGRKVRWKMVLAWTRDMELFKRGAIRFARRVSLLSESRLAIDVSVAPEGMTPSDVLGMLERDEVHCSHCFARDLAPRSPALEWFSSVPFGLTPAGYDAWLYGMGGAALWKQACEPLGFYPRSMGDTGPVRFGWSNRNLNGLDDFKGLRVPAQGVVSDVLARAGALPVLPEDGTPTVSALASGRLDAASWHGLFHERELGFHKAARMSWGPAWQAPAGRMMLCLNRKAFEALPASLRIIINASAVEEDHRLSADFTARNARAMAALVTGDSSILRGIAPEALTAFRRWSHEAAGDRAASSTLARTVRDSYLKALGELNAGKE